MGSGTSTAIGTSSIGVPINPRVVYADERSKKEETSVVIDAPVLVKLPHGTVRYRLDDGEENNNDEIRKCDKPHEGDERAKKHGYFYHSKLNDFSENASERKEEKFKFAYVQKGAHGARQKRLYYVFGKGLKTNTSGQLETPYMEKRGDGYQWPAVHKQHGHVYMDLVFLKQDDELLDEDVAADEKMDDMDPDTILHPLELCVTDKDTYSDLQERLAGQLYKLRTQIHVFHRGLELRSDDVLGALRKGSHGDWKRFHVLLRQK